MGLGSSEPDLRVRGMITVEVAGIEPVRTVWRRREPLGCSAKSRLAKWTFWTVRVAALTLSTGRPRLSSLAELGAPLGEEGS